MRVMLVVREFPRPSQTFIFNKACGLARTGMEVTVVALKRGDWGPYEFRRATVPTSLSLVYLERGKGLARLLWRCLAGWLGSWRRGRAPARAWMRTLMGHHRHPRDWARSVALLLPLADQRPDVLHFEHTGNLEDLQPLTHLLDVPLVVSCRSYFDEAKIDHHSRRALEELLHRADAIHCVSEATAASLGRFHVDPSKVVINRPAVDTSFFDCPGRDYALHAPIRIATVSRLVWKKGLSDGFRAIRELVRLGHSVEYRIAGGGVARELAEFEIEDMGLGDQVRLLGHLPQEGVREMLAWADICLHPSLTEGLSNAVIEAMAMALPVVSTDAGGMAELVSDGQNGFLVERRNVAALADRLARLIAEADLRRRLGTAARQTAVESFDLSRQIRIFNDMYRRLAAPRWMPTGAEQLVGQRLVG